MQLIKIEFPWQCSSTTTTTTITAAAAAADECTGWRVEISLLPEWVHSSLHSHTLACNVNYCQLLRAAPTVWTLNVALINSFRSAAPRSVDEHCAMSAMFSSTELHYHKSHNVRCIGHSHSRLQAIAIYICADICAAVAVLLSHT